MTRTLTENIARGRQAIALARRQAIDTASWEESLADLERQEILPWASEVSEQDIVLPEGVTVCRGPPEVHHSRPFSAAHWRHGEVVAPVVEGARGGFHWRFDFPSKCDDWTWRTHIRVNA